MDRPRRAVRSNPSRAAKCKKPVRQTRSTVAYLSSLSPSSSDHDSDNDDEAVETDTSNSTFKNTAPPSRKRKNNFEDYSPSPRKAPRRSQPTRNAVKGKPRKTTTPNTPNSTADTPATQVDQYQPPWSTLPYVTLKCIFSHVAAPIQDLSSRREDVADAVTTLLAAAQTCKTFCEPALTNLYRSPAFYHQWRFIKDPYTSFSQWVDTMDLLPDTTMVNYRPRVETLQIDVGSILTQKNNANYVNLQGVVRNLPRLSHLEFYHESDAPPYRKLDEHIRFKCGAGELLRALVSRKEGVAPTALKSWRWNSRLNAETLSLDKLEKFHQTPSFASLQKVAFVNYQTASWGMPTKVQASAEMQAKNHLKMTQLAACIAALPNLEYLILESSTLVNNSLLTRLPSTLKHLELINCWEVTAPDLAEFLLSNGHRLESLTLNHCQSLSLGFLPVLQTACPRLEHLYMDLSYFRHHEHYADNKPEYDTLLTENEVPRWPSSMRSIQIFHMRKWGRKAAETFFGSLVQSASDLPRLRCIAFKIAVDIGWRQRQELREFWVDKMVKIFKRKSKPPKDFKSLRSPPTEPRRRSTRQQDQEQSKKEPETRSSNIAPPPKRRSTRIRTANVSQTPTSSESEATRRSKAQITRASALSRELRLLKGSGLLLKEQDADDEESEDELAADKPDLGGMERKVKKISKYSTGDSTFIQGLCEIVDIQVDNHRPMERQFDMDDFLDSPEESDPDWDGGDVDVFD
ncbi:hypothetical protein M426DRAFT_321820 [Hypoxylon sp. CI-4A]|nr:hypothetical protein M426DRAFT_321820 [Hypoxylon sp. CI-4A]